MEETLAARSVAARGPVQLVGAAGKLAYFGAAFALYRSGRGTTPLVAFSALDLVFAGLFLYIALTRAPSRGRPSAA